MLYRYLMGNFRNVASSGHTARVADQRCINAGTASPTLGQLWDNVGQLLCVVEVCEQLKSKQNASLQTVHLVKQPSGREVWA